MIISLLNNWVEASRKKNIPIITQNGTWKSRKVKFWSEKLAFELFCWSFKVKLCVKTPLNENIWNFPFKNLPISGLSLEMTKNLKNTYLSMLSGFLDSNFCIQNAVGAIISM